MFKQRCMRLSSCLRSVRPWLTQTSRPWQKKAMGLYITSFNIATTSTNSITSYVGIHATHLPPVALCCQCLLHLTTLRSQKLGNPNYHLRKRHPWMSQTDASQQKTTSSSRKGWQPWAFRAYSECITFLACAWDASHICSFKPVFCVS